VLYSNCMKDGKWKGARGQAGSGAVYGLGFVGALVYFLQHSNNLTEVLLAILKSIVWPALLIYRVLETLKF